MRWFNKKKKTIRVRPEWITNRFDGFYMDDFSDEEKTLVMISSDHSDDCSISEFIINWDDSEEHCLNRIFITINHLSWFMKKNCKDFLREQKLKELGI